MRNTHAQTTAMASAFQEHWLGYIDTLPWLTGKRDESSYSGFLRAASLNIDPSNAIAEIAGRIAKSGGYMAPSKLQNQCRRAYEYVQGAEVSPADGPVIPKATYLPEKASELASRHPEVNSAWLIENSPKSVTEMTSVDFLNSLFQPGERVLIFTNLHSQGDVVLKIGADACERIPDDCPDGVWFLSNPVDGEYRPNPRQQDSLSRRSEESITAFRYLVLESDQVPESMWLPILAQLPLRIAAIYSSGGKSIHALVRLDAVSKAEWDNERNLLRPTLMTLGADGQAMTAVRLTRLPGMMRGSWLQKLLYLNPTSDGTPIVNRVVAGGSQ